MTLMFFDWMEERERIRQKREDGEPWPWTDDPVLRQYSFTNVMREYDKVSVWIQDNITELYDDHPDLWIMLAIARQINWPDSLEILLQSEGWPKFSTTIGEEDLVEYWTKWDIRKLRRDLDAYQATGAKVYTGAYMIHADSDARTSDIWINKNHYILGMVIGQLIGKKPPMNSIEAFVKWMKQFESWGGFMSYEVACDLRWAPSGWLSEAPDIRTWANPGPGAYRGLNRIHKRGLKDKVPEAKAIDEMRDLLKRADVHPWGIDWPRGFELRDIEHSLCEYDKYLRATLGEGRPRAMYKPPRT